MKTVLTFIIGIVLSVLFVSCKDNTIIKTYYDTGELRFIDSLMSEKDSISYIWEFYKDGVIKAEGKVNKNAHREGFWKEYYSDGALKWQGEFINGDIVIANDTLTDLRLQFVQREPIYLTIYDVENEIEKSEKEKLTINKKYKLRAYVEGVNSPMIIVTDGDFNKLSVNEEDPEKYPYYFIPQKNGKFQILLLFPNKDGYVIAEPPYVSFDFEVVGGSG
jgi:hypothetical protein